MNWSIPKELLKDEQRNAERMDLRPVVHYCRVRPDAVAPFYAHDDDAGMDLSVVDLEIVVPGTIKVWTGLALAIPPGYEGQLRLRSSLGNRGWVMPNAPATIDAGYRGEISVLMHRLWGWDTVDTGERVAQMVIAPVARATLHQVVHVSDLGKTERGTGGYGSTGKR
jgi:dUTP pyrophosphatase